MEALGSPIREPRWTGATLSEYRKLEYADDRYNNNILSFAYLCRSFISREKSEKSMCYLKIYIKIYLVYKNESCLACKQAEKG